MIPVAALPAAIVKIIVQAFKHPTEGMKIEIDGTSVNVASWDESFPTDVGRHSEASVQARRPKTVTEPRHAKTVS